MSDVLEPRHLHSILDLLSAGVTPPSVAPVVRHAIPYPVSYAACLHPCNQIDDSNIREWTPQQIAKQVQLELARLQREINTRDARILSLQFEIKELRAEVADLHHDIGFLRQDRL